MLMIQVISFKVSEALKEKHEKNKGRYRKAKKLRELILYIRYWMRTLKFTLIITPEFLGSMI